VIWLAWRQFRTQALVVTGALAALAVALAITGPRLVHTYDTTVRTCRTHGDCGSVMNAFSGSYLLLQGVTFLVLLAPALIGIFWGAPLVARELETGTFRLAWTQSVSRSRWFVTKVVLIGLACVVVAGLLSLMVTWWFSPIDRVTVAGPFSTSFYDRRDIVPVAYAAFAFALGVTAGILIRRTLPAMAATLVGYIGTRVAVFDWVRPYFMTPLRVMAAFQVPGGNGPFVVGTGVTNATDWVISDQTLNASGAVIGQNGGLGSNGGFGVMWAPMAPCGCRTGRSARTRSGCPDRAARARLTPRRSTPPPPGPSASASTSSASKRSSPTSRPVASGPSSGTRRRSSSASPWRWPASACGGSAAACPDATTAGPQRLWP
jgi:hypothetical protein